MAATGVWWAAQAARRPAHGEATAVGASTSRLLGASRTQLAAQSPTEQPAPTPLSIPTQRRPSEQATGPAAGLNSFGDAGARQRPSAVGRQRAAASVAANGGRTDRRASQLPWSGQTHGQTDGRPDGGDLNATQRAFGIAAGCAWRLLGRRRSRRPSWRARRRPRRSAHSSAAAVQCANESHVRSQFLVPPVLATSKSQLTPTTSFRPPATGALLWAPSRMSSAAGEGREGGGGRHEIELAIALIASRAPHMQSAASSPAYRLCLLGRQRDRACAAVSRRSC